MKRYGRLIMVFVIAGCGLTALTHLNSCGLDCPEHIYLGHIPLRDRNFFPFKGGERFTFVNQKGEEQVFFDSLHNKIDSSWIIMRTLCIQEKIDVQFTYYDSEVYNFYFPLKGEKKYFRYNYRVQNEFANPNTDADTVLFDTFYAEFYSPESDPSLSNVLHCLASDRGNTLLPTTNRQYNISRIISDTTIHGIHYSNLYCAKHRPGLFYSTTYGVVLFYDKSEWWHLKM